MASHGRKGRHMARATAPLAGEALARTILALPPQLQRICCRIEGCLEPLVTSYHKKHKICLSHSTAAELSIEGRTCRWCQQCGRFHGLDVFDARRRSCRHSLARHQERRKRRQAYLASCASKGKQTQPNSIGEEDQAPAGEQEQRSPQGGAERAAQAQPEPLLVPVLEGEAAQPTEQVAAPKPRKPASPAKQQRRRPAAGMQPGGRAEVRAASVGPAAEQQLLAEQPSLPAEQTQSLFKLQSAERPQLTLPPDAPPAASVQQAQQAQQTHPPPSVIPPGQPSSQAGSRGPMMAEAAPPMCAPLYAVSAQWSLKPALQQAATAPAHAAWGQQEPASPSAAAWATAPVDAAWGCQLPATPAAATWGQQSSDGGRLLIIGNQRLTPAQQPMMHQQALLPVAACEMQQPAGQAFWPVQQAQHAQHACSAGGATHYPRYQPATVQEPQMQSSVMLEALPWSPFVEVAACSASMSAVPLSPHTVPGPRCLPPCGSAAASAYTPTPSLPQHIPGSFSPPQRTGFYTAKAAGPPTGPSLWIGAGLLAAPAQRQPASLPPEGYAGSSGALNQACDQPSWHNEEQHLAPLVVATLRTAALLPSQHSQQPSPCAELPVGLQPNLLPSPRATVQSNMTAYQLPSPCAELPPNLLPSRLPSLPLPQALPTGQQAQQLQQQQCWDADWADESLIPSPLACPPSPAISWLAGFS